MERDMNKTQINTLLCAGILEYYSRDLSVLVDWDGENCFTVQAIRNKDNVVLETKELWHPISATVAWEQARDVARELKYKYIVDYGNALNLH